MYDKPDDFDWDIVKFPFVNGDIYRATSYGVYISQFFRFARASRHVPDIKTWNKISTAKFIGQG